MWKPTIVLSILLFASTAMSADADNVDAETINDTIEHLIRQVQRKKQSAGIHISKNYIQVVSDNFWKTPRNGTNDAELKFTDSGVGFEITNTSEINDQSCRDYVQTFAASEREACKLLLGNIMSLQRNKITKLTDETEAFLGRSKISHDINDAATEAPSNNESFRAKIKSLREVVRVTEESIDNAMNVALGKISNYVKEFSYCLISRRNHDLEVVREWWEQCSYCTQG